MFRSGCPRLAGSEDQHEHQWSSVRGRIGFNQHTPDARALPIEWSAAFDQAWNRRKKRGRIAAAPTVSVAERYLKIVVCKLMKSTARAATRTCLPD